MASFAKLEPDMLLKETQRAAGTQGELIQQQLVTEQNEINQKKMVMMINEFFKDAHTQLEGLREKNARLERDVQKLQEQEKIEKEIDIVKAKIVFAKYQSHVDLFAAQKDVVTALQTEYNLAAAPLEPLATERDEAKEVLEAAKQKEQRIVSQFKSETDEVIKCSKKVEEGSERRQVLREESLHLKRKEKQRLKALEDSEATIEREERKLENMELGLKERGLMSDGNVMTSNIPGLADIQAQLEKLQSSIDDLEQNRDQVLRDERIIKGQLLNHDNTGRSVQKQLENLDNIRVQRLKKLQEVDRDTYDAVLWIREHRNSFQGRVYEPVILEMSAKDVKYANLIEGSVPTRVLNVFHF